MTPRRLASTAAIAVAAVASLAACGDSTAPAATVDGTAISQQDVVDELEAIRGNTGYVDAIESSGQSVLGEASDAFDSAFVAQQLALRINYAIVGNEVERRHLRADDECRAAAESSLTGQLAQYSTEGDGEAVLAAFDDPYGDYLVDRETDFLLLQGDLIGQPCVADDAVSAYFEEHRDEFELACSAHILVDTQAEADEIVELLRGGADFATLATERSTDTGSAADGGRLPCVGPGEFVPEFDAALIGQEIGEIGEPVQSSFGFHVIRVDSREVPPLDEVRDRVAQALQAEVQEAFRTWFVDALAAADVVLDTRYGDWDPTSANILRPTVDETATTLPPEG